MELFPTPPDPTTHTHSLVLLAMFICEVEEKYVTEVSHSGRVFDIGSTVVLFVCLFICVGRGEVRYGGVSAT